jgi:hypothetical protein
MITKSENNMNLMTNLKQVNRTLGCFKLSNQNGFALVTAIIISVAVFIMIVGMLYFVTKSTTMSGMGKTYTTSCEAADGTAEIVKDGIVNLASLAQLSTGIPTTCNEGYSFYTAATTVSQPCTINLTLPGALGTTYQALATITMSGFKIQPGYRIEFPPKAYAGGGNGIIDNYKIAIQVVGGGTNNTKCENTVFYRNFK